MSKYTPLWRHLAASNQEECQLSFAEIRTILGSSLDYSFLSHQKEALAFVYTVGKISLENRTIIFQKVQK